MADGGLESALEAAIKNEISEIEGKKVSLHTCYLSGSQSIQYNAWAFGLYVTLQNKICLYWVGEGF